MGGRPRSPGSAYRVGAANGALRSSWDGPRVSALCPCPGGALVHPLNASAAVSSRAIAPATIDVIAIPRVTAEFVDRAVHSTPRARATTPPRKPRGTPTRNAIESMSPTFCPSIAGSSAPTTPTTPARSAVRHHQRETPRTGNRGSGVVGGSGGGHACCSGAGRGKRPALTVSRDAIADPLSLFTLCVGEPTEDQGIASRGVVEVGL